MATWHDFAEDLLAAYPGRFDAEMVAAYIRSIQARGVTDPTAALTALRAHISEHPPTAPTLAATVLRQDEPDPPPFDEVIAFASRTIASWTRPGDDTSAYYVRRVREHLGEAAARWVAQIGVMALGQIPDGPNLDRSQEIRRRDYAKSYDETVADWKRDPRPRAIEAAERRDALRAGEIRRPVAGEIEGGS